MHARMDVNRNVRVVHSLAPPHVRLDALGDVLTTMIFPHRRAPGCKPRLRDSVEQRPMEQPYRQTRRRNLVNPLHRGGFPLTVRVAALVPDGRQERRVPVVPDRHDERPLVRVRRFSKAFRRVHRHAHIVFDPQEPVRLQTGRLLGVHHRSDCVGAGVRERHPLVTRYDPEVRPVVNPHPHCKDAVGIEHPRIDAVEAGRRQHENLGRMVRLRQGRAGAEGRLPVFQHALCARLRNELCNLVLTHGVSS